MKFSFKDLFNDLFSLIIKLVLLVSSIMVVYNVIAYEVLQLEPTYINTYDCKDYDSKGELIKLSDSEMEECIEKATQKAIKETRNEIKYEYAWSVSAFIICLPILFIMRKED